MMGEKKIKEEFRIQESEFIGKNLKSKFNNVLVF